MLYAGAAARRDKARERLENFGMRIVAKKVSDAGKVGGTRPPAEASSSELYLAIANSHVALATLFADTRWSHGTWAQSFGRVRVTVKNGEEEIEVRAERRVKVRFGRGRPDWATLVPLAAVIELETVD
jgi:hypothetical protein